MGLTDPDLVEEVYTDLDAAVARVAALDYTELGVPELLELQSHRERLRCAAEAVDHRILAALTTQTTPKEIGAKNWADVLRIRLRISATEARRRVRDMENLGPRSGLTGEALPPRWESAAAAQAAGAINTEHIAVIGNFIANLPTRVDLTTQTQCEQTLTAGARHQTPEELRAAAHQLRYLLDQDGPLPDDAERARKRSVRIGKQQPDGMSKVDGWLDPQARATLEAVHAKLGAPACATRRPTRASPAHPAKPRSTTTPAAPNNATTTPSPPRAASPSAPTSATTTACPSPSWSPPP
ncbi:hypothetical protein MAUB_44980 [Mycolicibacterium aubagnense]|uniref:DUF222 domain-containing protein n=1 Tax=Mycolicibacterium aubagnense TaxID=319707 RepID=A0ABM7IIZ5_9MYCO|nr:hypothetical protein MAUB_44980 [Mycolicibacterium aubagnense]